MLLTSTKITINSKESITDIIFTNRLGKMKIGLDVKSVTSDKIHIKEMIINGGSKETEVNELTVIPCSTPWLLTETTVTPDVHLRITFLS